MVLTKSNRQALPQIPRREGVLDESTSADKSMSKQLSKKAQELYKVLHDQNARNTLLQGKVVFLQARASQVGSQLSDLSWDNLEVIQAYLLRLQLDLNFIETLLFQGAIKYMDALVFLESIYAAPVPKKFSVPNFQLYSEAIDPMVHAQCYSSHVALFSKRHPSSLSLPIASLNNFLARVFCLQTSRSTSLEA